MAWGGSRLTAQDSDTSGGDSPDASAAPGDSDNLPTVDIPPDNALDLDADSVKPAAPSADPNAALPVPENIYPSLRQLLDASLDSAPRMQAQRAIDDATEGSRLVARSGLLPDLNASAVVQGRREDRLKTAAATKTTPSYNYWATNNATKLAYYASFVQPLYYWGALRNNYKIGKLQLSIAKERTTDEYRSLVQDVRSLYFQTIIKRVTWERAVFARGLEQKAAKILEAKLATNAASVAQVRRQEFKIEQAQLNEDRAQDDYRRSRESLARLCGVADVPEEAIPDDLASFDVPIPHLQSLTQAFLADIPGRASNLSTLRNQIEIEKLNYRNAKVRLRPRIDYTMGLSKEEQNYGNTAYAPYGVTALYAGIAVNWSIFDGFASKGTALSALARRRDLERVYRKTITDLGDATEDRFKLVQFAMRNMSISDRLLSATQRSVDRLKQNVSEGRASPDDVDAAELNVLDSRISTYNARADCMMKIMSLLSTIFEDPALTNLDRTTP